MLVAFTVVKYKPVYIPFALLAMAVHRIPLMLSKASFWKLMGCGENGDFSLKPDWQMWITLTVWENRQDFDDFYNSSFISKWWEKYTQEKWTMLCEPLASHGKWSKDEPFKSSKDYKNYAGPVAVLTRATIRPSKVRSFWSSVGAVALIMRSSKGFITTVSCGEAPLYLQATLSVWESMEDVMNFAYKSPEHAEVIKRTRAGKWYSEELFARFRPIASLGSMNGSDPLSKLQLTESC